MTRKTATLMLDSTDDAGGSARTVETALRAVPGVLRAHVNPVTEVAYVEYDAERCDHADLERAVESVAGRAGYPDPAPRSAVPPVPLA